MGICPTIIVYLFNFVYYIYSLSNQSISKLKDYNSDTLDVTSVREEMDEKDEEEVGLLGGGSLFGLEETRDILICFLFILNHIEQS